MKEPKPKKASPEGAGGPSSLRAPAKGDSSASDVPREELGATFVGGPSKPSSGPNAAQGDLTYVDPLPTPAAGKPRLSEIFPKQNQLQTGDLLGGRFEILDILGEGGMGTVYKALDREVDLVVALKLIRPDMAVHPAILARFKQELLTARQVTHKNVIRIHDLSEVDGVKFITMEFVEGHDLRRLLLDNGKLPPEQAVEIIRQVCLALDAAHSAGVIHRDLKPQNIMKDKQGRILVMDFGLARSLESDGMTQTGALLGTIEYMSPEQAMGKQLDGRSDLFAVGLIFYELLTCKMPFKADTAMASLLKRNQERALPAEEIDATIPKGLSDIVSKCLERDLNLRYQNAHEILTDLDAWQGKRPISASIVMPGPGVKQEIPWKWISAGALAVALAVGGWALSGKLTSKTGSKAAAGPEVSLAILPFRNASTDLSIDWLGPSLADMLNTDVGQSAHLRTISPDRLHQVLSDLRITPGTTIDSTTVGRIAQFSNADTIVWGQYVKFGEQIRIDATLLDMKHDRRETLKIEAANEKEIPHTVDGLAELIRKNLSLSPDVLKELKASSFQPSTKSVAALREYNQSMQMLREGKNLDAVKTLQAAVKEDPQFALAYSRLAETDSALGYDSDAEQNSRKALELSQQLPLAEKYLIEANHARVMKDTKKAIEAYENLARTTPDNPDVEYALGGLYEDSGELDKALAHYGNVLKSDPKNLDALLATGRVQSKRGDPQAGLDSLSRALSIAVQIENLEQQAMILQATGIAYKLLGRTDDALHNYQQSMDINTRLGKKRGVAANLSEIAQVQSRLGKTDLALAGFNKALSLRREIGAKKEVGNTLINIGQLYEDRGQHDAALQNFKEALQIERDSGDEKYQAYCLNDIGNVDFSKGEYQDALIYFLQSLQLREKLNSPDELAETLSNVGAAMAKTGQYGKAIENHLRALDLERKAGDKRGAAFDSFNLGVLFGYQGRLGAAVNSTADAVKSMREMNDRSLWSVQALNSYADALTESGRGDEAQPVLKEGSALAKELKSDSGVAGISVAEGNDAYYRGDAKLARTSYQRALEAAQRAKSREDALAAQLGLARIQLQEGDSRRALAAFRGLGEQANAIGLKYVSLESSIYAAQALLHDKNYAEAVREAEKVLSQSEPQSMRMLMAQSHYVLGKALGASGNQAEAANHYRDAVRIWDEVRKEAGAEKTFERADLKSLYAEASQAAAVKN